MLIPNVTKGDDPYHYFENLADFISYEHVDREDFAMLASIGIEKGQPFQPDDWNTIPFIETMPA
jgi:hypothetical protein